jgi:hypothetical protein
MHTGSRVWQPKHWLSVSHRGHILSPAGETWRHCPGSSASRHLMHRHSAHAWAGGKGRQRLSWQVKLCAQLGPFIVVLRTKINKVPMRFPLADAPAHRERWGRKEGQLDTFGCRLGSFNSNLGAQRRPFQKCFQYVYKFH